jgi:hypothetical protein
MAEEFAENVVRRFTGEIASRLTKASALARTADTLNSQSLTEQAFDALVDVETLIFETTALLNGLRSSTGANAEENERANEAALIELMASRPVLCAAGARSRSVIIPNSASLRNDG